MVLLGRVVGVCVLVVALFYGLWWLVVPLTLALVIYFKLYELLFVGFFLDVYYAPDLTWPVYTGLAVFCVCSGMIVRPWLLNPKETT